jgi:hypothetical protein
MSSITVVEPVEELSQGKPLFTRYDGNYPQPKTKIEKAIYKRQQELNASSDKKDLATERATFSYVSDREQERQADAVARWSYVQTMAETSTVADIHLFKIFACKKLVALLVKAMNSSETRGFLNRDSQPELFSIFAEIPTDILWRLETSLNTLFKQFPIAHGTPVIPKNLDEASTALCGYSNKKLRVRLNKRLAEEAQKLMEKTNEPTVD